MNPILSPVRALRSALRQPLRLVVGSWHNIRNGSDVDYREVALGTSVGRGVAVMPRTRIDEYCTIGAHSYVGYGCFISRATIGPYASIANNVSIGPGEHDLSRISTSAHFAAHAFDELTARPLEIGADVWIGVDAIIRRGVKIGTGAVIGANSFVSHDVPPFAIVAGSPAKLIRYRFPPAIQERILDSNWWQQPPAEAARVLEMLQARFGEATHTAGESL